MKNLTDYYIEKMQQAELESVADMLTQAFETNPAYSLIFNKADLREGLTWLFRTSLFLLNRQEVLTRVVKEKDSGELVGTFSLVPPGGVKKSFYDYLQVGLPRFIYRFGFSALFRMLGMDNNNKKILTESVKAKEYYYLSMVVVQEKYRGKGIGSFAIGSCLDELLNTERNCHLLGLTTQLPENVSFYSRLGFEIIDEGEVSFRKRYYYNYNMKYVLA